MLLFTYIAACFGVALLSFFFCWSRRDWLWLVLALGFTLWADYFLILHNRHLTGVAVFCFAHLAYIIRAVNQRQNDKDRPFPWSRIFAIGLVVIVLAFIFFDAIYVVTGLYATLFISNIYVSARYLKRNRALTITGLLLFAACDICVMIFNMPLYFGAPAWLLNIFPLIWVFYLPSQALLAISAVGYSERTSKQ
ncbi:MAG: lysoplasmalogenase family protein [Defluviitaleaceae bacterium]|nr:lysoplasmalogenase family protein [Defluviitaleaceae bacterium]